jgi:hypothetical protein
MFHYLFVGIGLLMLAVFSRDVSWGVVAGLAGGGMFLMLGIFTWVLDQCSTPTQPPKKG